MAAVTDLLNQPLPVWGFMANAIAGGIVASGPATGTVAGGFGGFGVSSTAVGAITFTWSNPFSGTPIAYVVPVAAGTSIAKCKIVAQGSNSLVVEARASGTVTTNVGFNVLVFGRGTGTNVS